MIHREIVFTCIGWSRAVAGSATQAPIRLAAATVVPALQLAKHQASFSQHRDGLMAV